MYRATMGSGKVGKDCSNISVCKNKKMKDEVKKTVFEKFRHAHMHTQGKVKLCFPSRQIVLSVSCQKHFNLKKNLLWRQSHIVLKRFLI